MHVFLEKCEIDKNEAIIDIDEWLSVNNFHFNLQISLTTHSIIIDLVFATI